VSPLPEASTLDEWIASCDREDLMLSAKDRTFIRRFVMRRL
jgi:hypothetical protein